MKGPQYFKPNLNKFLIWVNLLIIKDLIL
jgi:hypothetical protein